MAWGAKRPCGQSGCRELVSGRAGMCPDHEKARRQRVDRERGSSAARGYGSRWQKRRKAFLAKHPLCVRHHAQGETVSATVVDHIRPHKGDPELFWDESNWQGLCKPCHDAKTAGEDGGWGRGVESL